MSNKLSMVLNSFLILALYSCNPKVSTSLISQLPPINYKQEVIVLGLDEPEPAECNILGEVKVGDTGFTTNCSYNVVLEKAKEEARKAGGNAIKIIDHRPPTSLGSTCHRITAEILNIKDPEKLISKKNEDEIIPNVDYAILNIYRFGGYGSLVGYDLYLGDSLICRVKNNFKTTIHIKKDGLNSIWAKTEAKEEIPIDIKFGKTYYIRCGITMGAFVGHPSLAIVDPKTGKSEFESFNAKNQ